MGFKKQLSFTIVVMLPVVPKRLTIMQMTFQATKLAAKLKATMTVQTIMTQQHHPNSNQWCLKFTHNQLTSKENNQVGQQRY